MATTSTVTVEQVEKLLQQLPQKKQWSIIARLINRLDRDDEWLEDLGDMLYIKFHGDEDNETISLEQLQENLRTEGLL